MIELIRTTEEQLDFVMHYEALEAEEGYVIKWSKEDHLRALIRESTYHMIILEDSQPVGYLIMNTESDNLELMRLVISKKNKGYGTQTLEKIKSIAFNELNCHRLWLDVRMHNENAIRLYEKLGFVREGVLREAVKYNDHYISVLVMSILRSEYV